MPQLYQYFGLAVFFYTNEHEPIHVHDRLQGHHARAEIMLKGGKFLRISFSNVKGKPLLAAAKMKDFQVLVRSKANDIVRRWVGFLSSRSTTIRKSSLED